MHPCVFLNTTSLTGFDCLNCFACMHCVSLIYNYHVLTYKAHQCISCICSMLISLAGISLKYNRQREGQGKKISRQLQIET